MPARQRTQFDSDALVEQVVEGRKTASVVAYYFQLAEEESPPDPVRQ